MAVNDTATGASQSPTTQNDDESNTDPCTIMLLWFRLPCVNGKPPPRDTPWVCFTEIDQHDIEDRYQQLVLGSKMEEEETKEKAVFNEEEEEEEKAPCDLNSLITLDETVETANLFSDHDAREQRTKHPTIAQWYTPDPSSDVMVDQSRHAVSLWFHCSTCHKPLGAGRQ